MDINEMRRKFREKKSQGVVPSNGTGSAQLEDDQSSLSEVSHPFKSGYSSTVSIVRPSYVYERGSNVVNFSTGSIDNACEETTGSLSLCCWISEKSRANGEWQNDNYAFVGSEELGYLEKGDGFPDINYTFEISDNQMKAIDGMNENGDEWHFVFTVNELHEDGNKYIIHTINGANENEDLYDEEDADVGSDCSDYALPSSQYYTHSDIVALLNNPFGRLWSLLANK